MASHLSTMEALASDPPKLQGGGTLDAQLLDDRHARLRLRHGSALLELRAAFLSVPYPSGLRRLIAREPALEAVIVDRIPPGLLDAAATEDVAVLDRHGYGRVVRPGFVYVAAPPFRAFSPRAPWRSPFAPKASRIVRMLLAVPAGRWRLTTIAEKVGLDPGNTHRVLASLLETGMVERDEDEYTVTDPGSLLEAWAEASSLPRERIRLPIAGSLDSTLRDLLTILGDAVAISGEFAAERWTPYLPAQSALLHCFERSAWERLGESADQPTYAFPGGPPTGQLLVLFADERVGQFGDLVEGFPLVHPAQVYVDMFRARGRGREAAEHLRREWLRY